MRLKLLSALLLSAAALVACKPKEEAPPPAAAATEDDKALYALGVFISQNVKSFDLTEQELARVQKGFADSIQNKTLEVKAEDYQEKLQALHLARTTKAKEAATVKNAAEGKAYYEKAEKEPGTIKTESGILIQEMTAGTGATPKASDTVKVHYHGTLPDGKVFDSSVERKTPAEFPLNGVIPCWTEGVQHIKKGGKSRLICPANLAYGENGSGPIGPNATLIFEVELLDIVK